MNKKEFYQLKKMYVYLDQISDNETQRQNWNKSDVKVIKACLLHICFHNKVKTFNKKAIEFFKNKKGFTISNYDCVNSQIEYKGVQ